MSYIFYILGAGIILYTLFDIIWTTLWVDAGAGLLTDRLSTTIWKVILKSNQLFLLNISGALILTVTLFTWFFLLWLGGTLFFAGNLNGIVHSSTDQIISWYQLPYYSGFVVFTLGIGDFTPQTLLFQNATALFSGLGMLMLTFGASYILSIVSAVVEKRTLARNIMGIGETSEEFILNSWNGNDFEQINDILSDVNSQITKYTQQIQAFPLLQYYHSEDTTKAATVAMAVLYESLLVLKHGIKSEGLINTTLLNGTIKSIHNFINVSADGYGNLFEEFDEHPPKADLSSLDHVTIPLAEDKIYTERINELKDERKQLMKILKIDHHEWPNSN